MRGTKKYPFIVFITGLLLRSGLAQTIELSAVIAKPTSRTVDLQGEFQPFLNVTLLARYKRATAL